MRAVLTGRLKLLLFLEEKDQTAGLGRGEKKTHHTSVRLCRATTRKHGAAQQERPRSRRAVQAVELAGRSGFAKRLQETSDAARRGSFVAKTHRWKKHISHRNAPEHNPPRHRPARTAAAFMVRKARLLRVAQEETARVDTATAARTLRLAALRCGPGRSDRVKLANSTVDVSRTVSCSRAVSSSRAARAQSRPHVPMLR